MSSPLRVGSVPYLVARPLDLGLADEEDIELVHGVPASLVEGLRGGALDVALVSSIELFRRPDYRYLDGLAVATRGFISSVQVFLRRPLAEARTWTLDPSSRAAAALTRVMLHGEGRGDLELRELPLGQDPRAEASDGWLRIGDVALREYLEPDRPEAWCPSEVWSRTTGLPFAFAVWIVAPNVVLGEHHLAAFRRARTRGAAAIDALAARGAREWELPEAPCQRYLAEESWYEPGELLRPALETFGHRAAALGLARSDACPRAIDLLPRAPTP